MAENQRVFSYLYFKAKELNGKPVIGKYEPLKVRFLYAGVSQIPMGRVHLYSYAPKKFTRVLCLKNGLTNKNLEHKDCPMCKVEQYGTPSNKYYAFVSDLNDNGALKLLEFNWSLGKQIDEIAEIKGRALHDMVFTLSKKGQGKETTYTPLFEEVSEFNVENYFSLLGLEDYPKLVGKSSEKASILDLSLSEMEDFINGKFPWSSTASAEAQPSRKYTMLGTTVTARNEHATVTPPTSAEEVEEFTEDFEDVAEIDDRPKSESFF